MKTFRAALLAAAVTAGFPALAMAQDRQPDNERYHEHGGRPDGGGQRPEGGRPDGGQRPDRAQQQQAQPAPQAQPQPQQAPQNVRNQEVQRQAAPQGAPDRGNFDRRDFNRGDNGRPGGDSNVRPDQARGFQGRDDRRPDDRNVRPDQGPRGYVGDPNRDRDRGNWDRGRQGFDRPNGYDRGGSAYRGDWRQDRRYDWRGFRDQHREVFRAQRYVAPRGWGYGYRRFDIGFRLPPFLFGQDYWIADPWMYRLPPVDGPYRWVRYYNDVLLIDLRSGEIVDEIPGFFW